MKSLADIGGGSTGAMGALPPYSSNPVQNTVVSNNNISTFVNNNNRVSTYRCLKMDINN